MKIGLLSRLCLCLQICSMCSCAQFSLRAFGLWA